MLVSRCVGRRQDGGGRAVSSKRDRAGSSRMGVAHYRQRPIFGPMLGLGRTAGRTDSAEFGCRSCSAGRVHRRPEPLIRSEFVRVGLTLTIATERRLKVARACKRDYQPFNVTMSNTTSLESASMSGGG